MQDKSQGEATDSLRSWGMYTYKAPDVNFSGGGRADVFAVINGLAVMIEVKNGGNGFAFNQWQPNQRHWAKEIQRVHQLDYWLWIELGKEGSKRGSNKNPKLAWLVPSEYLLWVESVVSPFQVSLPIIPTQNIMKELHLDAPTLLAPFELPWGIGVYTLPDTHPFYLAYLPPMIDMRTEWRHFKDPNKPPKLPKKVTQKKPAQSRKNLKSSLPPNGQQSLW